MFMVTLRLGSYHSYDFFIFLSHVKLMKENIWSTEVYESINRRQDIGII